MLHEPWAVWESPSCPSADKVLNASRALMSLMYTIASTSFDVSLLDFLPYVRNAPPNIQGQCWLALMIRQLAWYSAGRTLVKFLKAAIDTSQYDLVIPLQTEVAFVQYVALSGLSVPHMLIELVAPS